MEASSASWVRVSERKNLGGREARQPKHKREAKLKNGGSGDAWVRGAEVLVAW